MHDEVIKICKVHFIAELFNKLYFQSLTIQVTFKIKQMGFNEELLSTYGRTCPKVRHPVVPAIFCPTYPDRKNSLNRAG